MKVPFYSSNYTTLISAPYTDNFGGCGVEFKTLLKFLTDEFIQKYKAVDVRKVGDYISQNKATDNFLNSTFDIDGKSHTWAEVLTAIKLLMPTLWNCNYFIWDIGVWTHHWVDILMPKWTPLPAFKSWKVVKIKQWDGAKKDEWNCVVIQTDDNVFICYEHLDTISVTNWQSLNQWDTVWTCWNSWNSTQNHLHLQIDASKATFHPFWSSKLEDVKSNTLDPIKFLRSVYAIEGWVVVSTPVPATNNIPSNNPTPAQPVAKPTPSQPVTQSTKPVESKPESKQGGDDMIGDIMSELNKAYK